MKTTYLCLLLSLASFNYAVAFDDFTPAVVSNQRTLTAHSASLNRTYKFKKETFFSPSALSLSAKPRTLTITETSVPSGSTVTAFDVRTLDPRFPAAFDQGNLGSCTANALAALVRYVLDREGKAAGTLSRLFIYYNERLIEGTVNQDAGASLADGIYTLHKYGVCNETLWPYSANKFTIRPPASAYLDGLKNVALGNRNTESIQQSLTTLKYTLSVAQRPFVFGIAVYESFESAAVARTGMVPMPKATEQYLGGHAVLAVGFNDKTALFTVRNSWGPNWGVQGYFYLPYQYVLNPNLATDFWSISTVGAA